MIILFRKNFFESSLDLIDLVNNNFLFSIKVFIALTNSSLLLFFIKKPFSLFVISEFPPTSVAIVGIPKLMNSIRLLDKPSSYDELIPTSVILKKFCVYIVASLKEKYFCIFLFFTNFLRNY